jgi:hypothetical protein
LLHVLDRLEHVLQVKLSEVERYGEVLQHLEDVLEGERNTEHGGISDWEEYKLLEETETSLILICDS